tara:strand:- start:3222 stop:3488 length:267 start_codon:yes stop_codon:yes gene_type:complete
MASWESINIIGDIIYTAYQVSTYKKQKKKKEIPSYVHKIYQVGELAYSKTSDLIYYYNLKEIGLKTSDFFKSIAKLYLEKETIDYFGF